MTELPIVLVGALTGKFPGKGVKGLKALVRVVSLHHSQILRDC